MKILYTSIAVTFLLVIAQGASAQTKTVTYFSKKLKEVPAQEAHYYEVTEEDATGGGTKTRFLVKDDLKVRVCTYSDLDGGKHRFGIKAGLYREWFENGKQKVEATYAQDTLTGVYKSWYESGNLYYKRNYSSSQDTLTTFYESGKVRRVEVYQGQEMLTGKVYDEDGKEIAFIPMFQLPRFPGGESLMMSWLANNIKYPKQTIKSDVQGTVLVSFIVDKSGKIRDAEIMRGIHYAADAEALRVINKMPDWEPGLDEGKAVSVRFTLPVMFALHD
ncbi:MAG TPA: TonB family protein [Pontibacter sp.]